jgi:hypothetical protein
MPVDVSAMRKWVEYLVNRYDRADRGGVAIYCLDNEPTIWLFVHRDVHPKPPSYVQIPASVTPGDTVPVTIQVGGVSSQPNVTIAVK